AKRYSLLCASLAVASCASARPVHAYDLGSANSASVSHFSLALCRFLSLSLFPSLSLSQCVSISWTLTLIPRLDPDRMRFGRHFRIARHNSASTCLCCLDIFRAILCAG